MSSTCGLCPLVSWESGGHEREREWEVERGRLGERERQREKKEGKKERLTRRVKGPFKACKGSLLNYFKSCRRANDSPSQRLKKKDKAQ